MALRYTTKSQALSAMEYMMRKLTEEYQNWGLTVNVDKTQYLCIGNESKNEVALQQQQDDQDDQDQDDNNSELDEEEEGGDVVYNESSFKFQDLLKRLAHPKIVRACGLALKQFETNSVNTNHCIIKLLHRIAFECKMYVMLFQFSIFRTFQKIYRLKDLPQHKELVKFATYIIRQFIKVSEGNKKVFMEALFWKSAGECYEIETNYTESGDGHAAAQKAWTEEQEDEIRRLFMEHKETNQQEDVVDWVLENLIDSQNRTRRGVLKKMKEMHLIVDYRGRKKSAAGGGSRAPRNWIQEEEEQLQELFEMFKDTDDPLGFIMEKLDVSRPKNRIVEKLLIMGLIQDKKEVYKKRSRGGNKSKGERNESDHDSEEIVDTSDSEDETRSHRSNESQASGSGAQNSRTSHKKKSAKTKNPQRKKSLPKVAKNDLIKMVLDVMENEMHEALEWLKDSLSDAIEDYQEGAEAQEGIPLVPLMDYAETAMENDAFLKMLRGFGCTPPFDEQESYWRIPGHLTPELIQTHCDLIQQALDKTLSMPDDIENAENNKIGDNIDEKSDSEKDKDKESSDDDDLFDKIRKMQKQKLPDSDKLSNHEENSNFSIDDERSYEAASASSAQNSNIDKSEIQKSIEVGFKRLSPLYESNDIFQQSLPESIQDFKSLNSEASNKINEAAKKARRSKIVRSVSSSESEAENEKPNKDESKDQETSLFQPISKNLLDSDSGSDQNRNENMSKSKIFNSDSEDEMNATQKRDLSHKSRSKILDSDSDNEDTKENQSQKTEVNNQDDQEEVTKRGRSASESDQEKPPNKKSRVIDSDDD